MMNSIAATATAFSAADVMQQYAVSMTKNAMETTETLAQGVLEMLPPPSGAKYIDVYA